MFLQSVNNIAMESALNAIWKRSQLIAGNIANEDTPGYKAKRLGFESLLANELDQISRDRKIGRREAVNRLSDLEPVVYEQTNTIARADGNNVDVLAEQAEYSRVQLQFQALSQRVSSYYTTLQYAISGGR